MASKGNSESGRRVSVDLTPSAAAEIDRLREATGLTTADIFRHALSLFRLYVNAKSQGKDFVVMGGQSDTIRTQIELPLEIQRVSGE